MGSSKSADLRVFCNLQVLKELQLFTIPRGNGGDNPLDIVNTLDDLARLLDNKRIISMFSPFKVGLSFSFLP